MLEDLKIFARDCAESLGISEQEVFDTLGMEPIDPPENYGYGNTPKNSISITRTGGDGVHYGVVGDLNADSPVILTIPMAWENVIVGENLLEFLCLGCCTSYFWLEQLVYDYNWTVNLIQQASDVYYGKMAASDYSDGTYLSIDDPVFTALRRWFDLKPWQDVDKRLKELQALYADKLVVEEI